MSDFVPWADQWAFLASVRKIGRRQVEEIVEDAERRGRVLGVRLATAGRRRRRALDGASVTSTEGTADRR